MKPARILSVTLMLLSVTAVLCSASVANACPSCAQALGGDTAQGDLARGIYYSVVFMMVMPFAIVGTFAGFAYRAVKREQRRLADQAQDSGEQDDRDPFGA